MSDDNKISLESPYIPDATMAANLNTMATLGVTSEEDEAFANMTTAQTLSTANTLAGVSSDKVGFVSDDTMATANIGMTGKIHKPEEVGLTSIADVIRYSGEASQFNLAGANAHSVTVSSATAISMNVADGYTMNSAPNGNGMLTLSGPMPKGDLVVTTEKYGQVHNVVEKVDLLASAIDAWLPEFDTSLRDAMAQKLHHHFTEKGFAPAYPKAVLDVGIRASRFTLDGLYNHVKTGNAEMDSYLIETIGGFFTDMSKPEVPNILASISKMLKFCAYMDYIRTHGFDQRDFGQFVLNAGGVGDRNDICAYLDSKIKQQGS